MRGRAVMVDVPETTMMGFAVESKLIDPGIINGKSLARDEEKR